MSQWCTQSSCTGGVDPWGSPSQGPTAPVTPSSSLTSSKGDWLKSKKLHSQCSGILFGFVLNRYSCRYYMILVSCIKRGIFHYHEEAFKYLSCFLQDWCLTVYVYTYVCKILNIFNLHVHKHGNIGLLHIYVPIGLLHIYVPIHVSNTCTLYIYLHNSYALLEEKSINL